MILHFYLFLLTFCAGNENVNRVKRDNGAAFEDSGGPVAQESSSNANGKELDPELQKVIASFDPCETKARNESIMDVLKKHQGEILSKQFPGFPPAQFAEKFTTMSPETLNAERNVSVEEHFQRFLKKFGKSYPTKNDEQKALENFKQNFDKIAKLGLRRTSPFDASFVANKFSDIDFGEFQKSHLGALPPLDKPLIIPASLIIKNNCSQMNWTSLGVVPVVRKQDNCGCCYAMSTADLVAVQYQIDRRRFNESVNLSPQWLSDCMPNPAGYRCNGGRPAKVLETLAKYKKWKIPSETCYPFVDKNATCQYARNCTSSPEITIAWGKMADISGPNEKELMAALLQHGPVVAVVGVSQSWQLYNGTGILRPYQCSEDQNHAVVVVGYDYSGCVPTYLIRNSWGSDWGGRGYIKLEAGKNTCGVAKSVTFTCTKDKCGDDPVKYVLSTVQHPKCTS